MMVELGPSFLLQKTGGSSVLVRSSEESELSEESTVNTLASVEAILRTWHDGKK